MQGMLQDFRLLCLQKALLLDKLLVFYWEKYDASCSFLPENPLRAPDPAQAQRFKAMYFFSQHVADHAGLCILFLWIAMGI